MDGPAHGANVPADAPTDRPVRRLITLARGAFGLALAAAVGALLAGPGYRFSLWPLGVGIQIVTWSTIVALGAVLLGGIAAVLAMRARLRWAQRLGLLGVLIGLSVAAPPLSLYAKAKSLPRIHDISTDTAAPPAFVAVLPLRQAGSNSAAYAPEIAAAQRAAYPEIGPKVLKVPSGEAFARAERAAKAMGWQIVAASAADQRIEATDTTLLFGFKDDVVIRLTPQADGTRIDVRSASRVGVSDLGMNARRIAAYLARLDAD